MDGFSAAALDPSQLRTLAERLPTIFRLEPLDIGMARQLDADLQPHGLQTYANPEALITDGMSWGAITHGPEPRLACVASTYARSSRSVEVAISTRPEHRGQGLATAVAARFCLAALNLGLEPHWNAANPVSKRLARRLGFLPAGKCEILFLAG